MNNNSMIVPYEFQTEEGTTQIVYFEVLKDENAPITVAGPDLAQTTKTFQEALHRLKPVCDALYEKLKELNKPDEIGLEFGVALTAGAGVIIANVESQVNFKVSLKWKN